MAEISTSNEWKVHFDKMRHKLSLVVTYKPSAPSNPYKPPNANTPAKMGTTMHNDVLVIDNDDVPPTSTFTLMKWAEPHPVTTTELTATMTAAMTAMFQPLPGTSLDTVLIGSLPELCIFFAFFALHFICILHSPRNRYICITFH